MIIPISKARIEIFPRHPSNHKPTTGGQPGSLLFKYEKVFDNKTCRELLRRQVVESLKIIYNGKIDL